MATPIRSTYSLVSGGGSASKPKGWKWQGRPSKAVGCGSCSGAPFVCDVLSGTINVQGICSVTGGSKTGAGSLTGNCGNFP